MKKLLPLLWILSLFIVFGCSDSSEEPPAEVNEFEVLVNYLENGDENYQGWVNNLSGWIVNLSDINTADYYVLDLRSEADYNTLHIPDAVNSTLDEMFDKVQNATKDILVVCYSGQTASFAHMLLRLKGYDAYVLKFGMSIYDSTLDKWTGNCSNKYAADPNWVTTASPALPEFDFPKLNTGKTEAEDILDARIQAAIYGWKAGMLISADDAMNNRDSYNIMNYWSETDYTNLGHINGAYQLTPKTLKTDENLKVFDPNGDNILYCWTGQTAAATIAYLKVLGYDVKSIKFGTNAMIYDQLPGHKWPKPWGK